MPYRRSILPNSLGSFLLGNYPRMGDIINNNAYKNHERITQAALLFAELLAAQILEQGAERKAQERLEEEQSPRNH